MIEVHREWAPLGADHFYELVKAGYYNDARFFRVVPKFVAQFGLAATPALTKQWDKSLDDDPVGHTNSRGTVAFATAGKNSRTTQVFINLRSNQVLDDRGFAAFGQVVEGMDKCGRQALQPVRRGSRSGRHHTTGEQLSQEQVSAVGLYQDSHHFVVS